MCYPRLWCVCTAVFTLVAVLEPSLNWCVWCACCGHTDLVTCQLLTIWIVRHHMLASRMKWVSQHYLIHTVTQHAESTSHSRRVDEREHEISRGEATLLCGAHTCTQHTLHEKGIELFGFTWFTWFTWGSRFPDHLPVQGESGCLAAAVGCFVEAARQEVCIRIPLALLQQVGKATLHRALGGAVQFVAGLAVLQAVQGGTVWIWGSTKRAAQLAGGRAVGQTDQAR